MSSEVGVRRRGSRAGIPGKNASPTNGYRLNRAGLPLLIRYIFHIVRTGVSPIVDRRAFPHLLRHSFASRLRENGAPLELIQEAMGHANLSTTMVYAHLSSSKRRTDLTRFLGRPARRHGRQAGRDDHLKPLGPDATIRPSVGVFQRIAKGARRAGDGVAAMKPRTAGGIHERLPCARVFGGPTVYLDRRACFTRLSEAPAP